MAPALVPRWQDEAHSQGQAGEDGAVQSRGDQDVVILSGGVKKEGEESGVTHRVLTCMAE